MSVFNMFKKNTENYDTLIELSKKLNEKKSYFSNGDKYENDKRFIRNFVGIITGKEFEPISSSFEDAIKYLLDNGYMIEYNNDNLVEELNNRYYENLNNDLIEKALENYQTNDKYSGAIQKNIIETEICNQLESKGKGLIYIYSAGDFYCYRIDKQEKIDQIRNLFEEE